MSDDTIPCPMERVSTGSGIGGAALTECRFCGELNNTTAITRHRPIVLSELRARLVKADDYDLVVAERDHARNQLAGPIAESARLRSRLKLLRRAYHRLHGQRVLYLAIAQAAALENTRLQEILRLTIGPDPDYPDDGFTFRWPEFTDEQATLIREIIIGEAT